MSRAATQSDRTTVLWEAMRNGWERGERTRVEDFIRSGECDPRDEGLLLDLIYAECALREDSGEAPELSEYVSRFPKLAPALRRQWDVHRGFEDDSARLAETLVQSGTESSIAREKSSPFPRAIGKYPIVARLGTGGQADVYRGVHPLLGMDVIIKVVRPSSGDLGSQVERLLREGKILAELEHPNIARIHDLDYEGARPFLVMEYVPGLNLEQHAASDPPTPARAAERVAKIARAVAVAHRKGITHRDLKPRNVVIDRAGGPRVIDFGMSELIDAWSPEMVAACGISGTLAYMAPEQAKDEGRGIDHRTDIFAMGGILFFLLTGHPPISGDRVADVLTRVTAGDWDRERLDDPAIPPRLRAICTKALDANPSARYTSADALADDLERETAVRPRTRRAVGFAVAVAAVTLFAVTLATLPFRPDSSRSDEAKTGLTGSQSAAGGSTQPAAIDALRVQAWRGGQYADVTDVVPMRTGDRLRIEADIPAGAHASLFLIDSEGSLARLAHEPARDKPFTFRYPAQSDLAAPLVGRDGTEFVFLCVRGRSPVELPDIQSLWDSNDPLPELPELSVLEMRPDEVDAVQSSRGLGNPVRQFDPEAEVRARIDAFRQRLAESADAFAGVAFSHRHAVSP